MVDCIEGHRRRLKREKDKREAEAKDQSSMLYIQALQIGNVLSHMFDDKVAIKPLSAYYPGLFVENEEPEEENNFTKQEDGDKKKLTPEMELYKANMDDYIFRHNRAIAQKRGEISGGHDTREAASNN